MSNTTSFFVPTEFTSDDIFAMVIIIGLVVALTIFIKKYFELKKKYFELKNGVNEQVEQMRQYYNDLRNKERKKLWRIPTQLKNIAEEIEGCYKQEEEHIQEDTENGVNPAKNQQENFLV